MSEADSRFKKIQSRVEASQERLKRESEQLPALPQRAAPVDAYPPEDFSSLAKEHPWLIIAAGAGAGLLLGALMPGRIGTKLRGRALGLAAAGAELALVLGRNAHVSASEGTAPLRRRAGAAAAQGSRSARSTGVRIAGEAIKLAARLRK